MAFTYETGPTGFGLYDTLTDLDQQCLLVPSHAIPEAIRNIYCLLTAGVEQRAPRRRKCQPKGVSTPSECR